MAIPKTILFLLTIIILSSNLQAQKYQLSDFKETALPKLGSNEWYQFLKDTYDFKVGIKRGKLKIGEYDSNDHDREVELPVDGGKVVGTDNGEFGGQLTFEGDDGNSILIKKGNFRFLFIYKHEVYFIDTSEPIKKGKQPFEYVQQGGLYRLMCQNDTYSYLKIFDFDEFPVGMCIVKEDIMVISWNYVYKIHNLQKEIIFNKETIFDDSINELFTLNSIAAADFQHIYMGTGGGYLQFDLTNKSYKYYKYKE